MKYVLWMIVMVSFLSGCNKNNPSDVSLPDAYQVERNVPPRYEAEVKEYHFGSGEYEAQSGKIMPYDIKGIVGLPKGEGPFPLIMISHGSHANDDESKRFDTGFSYLVEGLAKQGYIAVSMDLSKAYIWKYGDTDDKEKSIFLANEHRRQLETMEAEWKIDFNQLGLVGHSRGGDMVFDLAVDFNEQGFFVGGILSIAPIMASDLEEKSWTESAVSILVPEYDGDVVGLEGFAVDRVLQGKELGAHAVTLLKKANHNYFNTNLMQNDALLIRDEKELEDQLTPTQQQEFLLSYTLDFFDTWIEKSTNSWYDLSRLQPEMMYGHPVKTRYEERGKRRLFDGLNQGAWQAEQVFFETKTDSWYFLEDEVDIDTLTFGQGAYKEKLISRIIWEEPGGSLSLESSKDGIFLGDLSSYRSLVIGVVTDPTSEKNEEPFQRFSVLLEDKKGNVSLVALPKGLGTLEKIEGKMDMTPVFERDIHFFTPSIPVCTLRIPLTLFDQVDLNEIVRISLVFDQTSCGSIYVEEISLN